MKQPSCIGGLYCPPHKSTGLYRISVDSEGLQWTPVDSNSNLFIWYLIQFFGTGLDWSPQDCREIHRTPQDLRGLKGDPQDCRGLEGNPLDYLIIAKYIYISTCRDSNKIMYFVQLAGLGHVTTSHETPEVPSPPINTTNITFPLPSPTSPHLPPPPPPPTTPHDTVAM